MTDPEELCCAVVQRGSEGPCQTCGFLRSGINAAQHGGKGLEPHPYLGPPIALCGHSLDDHAEHENEDGDYWVCESCYYWEGRSDAALHEYVRGRPCPECGGSSRLLEQGDVVGPLGSCPNPDCVLGYVPGSELSLRG